MVIYEVTSVSLIIYAYYVSKTNYPWRLISNTQHNILEAFSPAVEKRVRRFFESKTFGVCVRPSRIQN